MNTVAKNRRILTDHGTFESFKEDKAESERVYAANGTSEQEVLNERKFKQLEGANMTKANKDKAIAGLISDDAFEAEAKRRGLVKGKAPKKVGLPGGVALVPDTPKDEDPIVPEAGAGGVPGKYPTMKKMTVKSIVAELKAAGIMYSQDVTDKQGLYDILISGGKTAEDNIEDGIDDDDEDGL